MKTTLKLFGFFAAISMNGFCFAADVELISINATPKKMECKSAQVKISDESVKAELCIAQGSFSSDKYSLKFNGKLVLQGIDDQTAPGINANYNSQSVVLQCAPQVVRGDATAEDVRKLVPSFSNEKVNQLVDLMKGSTMPVEVARLCTISVEKNAVLKAQVFFE
ncbi:hypothetical protein [Janthinobacterium sp.]|uniref:hypothetical protein n=1 Tax=Janthinobacterium sp. TaxID=1871054 RepID=UPI00293D8B0E|nr:hypothetical protein [Janthinobacterium sp.]